MRYKYSQNLTEASEMTFAENEYQGIEQNGTMKRIPTTKVKQGVHNATHDHVDFATNPVADTNTVGRLLWDDDAKTLSIVRDNTGGTKVSVEIGDEIQVRVKNATGATILNGQPVYTTSALDNTPLIALADGDDPAKNRVTGLMTADIANNGVSYLTTVGLVRNVPIANIIDPADVSWTVGTYLYLSTVTGKLTKNRPSVGTAVRVGIITDISGSNCTILVYLRDDYAKIFDDIDNAITAIKGTGYTEGTLKTHEDRLDTLEGADTVSGSVAKTVKDAVEPIETRLDTTELTLARQGQDLASVKQTLQQGNGATLDFSGIGSVTLDARATGRANPTVEGLTATNLVVNGDFSAGTTGWIASASAISVFSGRLSIIGNGTAVNPRVYIVVPFVSINNEFYILAKVRVTSANCTLLRVYTGFIGGDSEKTLLAVANPVQNQWYYVATKILFATTASNSIYFSHAYTDSATANGKVMEIEGNYGVTAINLNATYGSGNEPSASDCAKIFSYFDGTKSISMPARVRSVGKNLFGENFFNSGSYTYNGITVTHLGNGEFLVNGTAVAHSYIRLAGGWYGVSYGAEGLVTEASLDIPYDGMATLSATIISGTGTLDIRSSSAVGVFDNYFRIPLYTPTRTLVDGKIYGLRFMVAPGVTISNLRFKLQIEAGSTATPYEPYQDSTLYIADNEEVRSVQAVSDTVSVVNGEHMLTKKISTPVSVASGVAVNVTNYPTAKTGGKFAVELTAGGTQIGVIGTDSTSGAGTLRFELNTPVITPLLTSGILQAKPNGSVYYEPYYEGSHQTNASSQITLPYEGTIDKLTGYDENFEPYEIPSTGYTLVGTLLTITGALENEVFYVEMQRSEPLAPEMSVNVLNNEQVIADTANGKFYKLVPTITNGVLVNQTPVEVV